MPGKPKFNSFGKLGEFLKKQELEAAGKKMVDASKNTAKGSRAKIKTGVVKQVPPKVSKVAVLKETPVELPEFKPYYINGENPNILTPEQQALKADLVKSNQIALANYQRELANRGINTSALHRRVGALAVATNPNAIMAPPEGMYKPTYNSATQEWEGAPLGEWFEMASNGMIPYGPNALWRKWEQPLKDATHSFDVLGQDHRGNASELTMQQLGLGLSQMEPYLGIKPPKRPYVSPSTTVKNKYIPPEINVVSNFIGPDMEPGIYGYHVATNEWWPITKRAAETAVGNTEKYSLFSAIGKYSLPIKIAHRHNVIEKGVNFEGDPFIVRYNAVSSDPEFYKAKQKIYWEGFQGRSDSGPDGWANSGSGSWKVRGKKQGGVLSAKSGIHIKKANRGKFTDYCGGKVTSACIARGKASSNPVIRKRATFAANARKWKHQNGGKIMPYWAYNILGGE